MNSLGIPVSEPYAPSKSDVPAPMASRAASASVAVMSALPVSVASVILSALTVMSSPDTFESLSSMSVRAQPILPIVSLGPELLNVG